MAQRQEATAQAIQQILQQAVDRLKQPVEGGAEIVIPPPQLVDGDPAGCNWDIPGYNGDRIYAELVARVVREAQASYRLRVE